MADIDLTYFTDEYGFDTCGFTLRQSGMIVCETCFRDGKSLTTWCDHIKHAVLSNADHKAIWTGDNLSEELTLDIPMFPSSDIDTWEKVKLVKYPERMMYRVYWINEVLCLLNPGEGRKVIRSVLIDKMLSAGKLECKAGHHDFNSEMRWQRDMKDDKKRFPQLWTVWRTEQCIDCNKFIADSPDLIPEKSGPTVFASGPRVTWGTNPASAKTNVNFKL